MRKGILLFHDIQPSTAHGIKDILDALKAGGFKVVHLVPKAPAATLAEYDAQADREIAHRKLAVAKAAARAAFARVAANRRRQADVPGPPAAKTPTNAAAAEAEMPKFEPWVQPWPSHEQPTQPMLRRRQQLR